MPELIIDNQPIQVPPGTKVIEAAERLGIMIPRFCYHPALGSVGACRLCAVMFLEGPVKGLQMSCMVDAVDGMVVDTTDAHAVDFRRQVIEWLMLHHPHDCPVCDEGGHCLLQDHTESSGHAIRRYRGPKRTHRDQYLGPLLQHEMNRCIQCYRCTRFYQEFAGYRDLSVMQIGNKVYFGRYDDGVLRSPFTGNLADICPTGVFTDKPSRYMGRRWDYQRYPSVCIHCSLGCNTVVSARYREVVRQEARFNPAVNGYFICDRGRHGYVYTNMAERPRAFRLDNEPVASDTALTAALERLTDIGRRHGLSSVACIGSLVSSLETQGALVRLCRAKGWPPPVFYDDAERLGAARTALAYQRPDLHVSMRDIENADAVLVVGCDPVNEAPMLALALRQAQRRGATVISVDARAVELPLPFRHIPLPLDRTAAWIDDLIGRIAAMDEEQTPPPEPDAAGDPLAQTARTLHGSRRPVIVCGTDAVAEAAITQTAKMARTLKSADRNAGLFIVLPGANALSAALFSEPDATLAHVAAGVAQGRIKALLAVETDPLGYTGGGPRLADALGDLEQLVVIDSVDGPHVRAASVFMPGTTIFESGGTFVNQEGRVQPAAPALTGGLPIRITGGGDHPPRRYGEGIPGAGPLPAWHLLSVLAEDAGFADSADILAWVGHDIPGFSVLAATAPRPAKELVLAFDETAAAIPGREAPAGDRHPPQEEAIDLITGDLTFGSETLSVHSPQLADLGPPPQAMLSQADARRLGLQEGDRIAIEADAGRIEVDVAVSGRMASGTLFLPRHHRLDWRRLGRRRVKLALDRIRKIAS